MDIVVYTTLIMFNVRSVKYYSDLMRLLTLTMIYNCFDTGDLHFCSFYHIFK